MAVQSVEARVTVVEHKVEENARRTDGLHAAIVELGNRMDRRFVAMDQRLVAMEERFDRRLEALEQRQSSNFRWMVGLQVTTMAGMLAAMATIVAAVLGR